MFHVFLKSVCMCILCFFTSAKLEPSSEPFIYKYRTLDEINSFIENILTSYNDTTSEIILGSSSENRLIRGVKISTEPESSSSGRKLGILIDGGIHAREWVSTAAALYALHQLVGNSSHFDLINGLDWYIIPMLNPDGYAFSMDLKGDRLWRKNMRVNLFSDCKGVDLNRNFDFAWGGPGSSENPCDSNYRGPHPLSEPESRGLAEFIKSKIPQINMYITLHSAAQAVVYPWGFTETRPYDWEELDELAKIAVLEMSKVNQTSYIVGQTTQTVGVGAGGSDDWAKGFAGIKFVYTMELPGLGYPAGGFHPPESALDVITQEAFQGIRSFASHLLPTKQPHLTNSTEQGANEGEMKTTKTEQLAFTGYIAPSSIPPVSWHSPWYSPLLLPQSLVKK